MTSQKGSRIRWYKLRIFERVFKTSKHEFGNTLLVAQLRLKSVLDKPQIKSNCVLFNENFTNK